MVPADLSGHARVQASPVPVNSRRIYNGCSRAGINGDCLIPAVQCLMTRSPQKEGERFFTEKAAKALNKEWCLGPDRENPDFIVSEGEKQFGLEVVYIFAGQQDEHGSHKKRAERDTQKAVHALRAEFEKKDDTPLAVKFVGDMCRENVDEVVPILHGWKLSAKPFGCLDSFTVDNGSAKLSVYITRAIQPNWFRVNDRVGWVNRNPIDWITETIEGKAKNLPRYKKCSDLDDIRLLIVADRRMNSGRLSLEDSPALDLRGFYAVYFFSYPESVTVFEGRDSS